MTAAVAAAPATVLPVAEAAPTPEETAVIVEAMLTSECAKFSPTDIGNGKRFALRYSDRARYCAIRKCWYLWDGTRWKADTDQRVRELAKATAIAINDEVALFPDKGDRAERQAWARASESETRLRAMLSMAETDESIRVAPDELDRDGNLFNCRNGTLELDTGRFRLHDPADLITKVAGVRYEPGADCPMWKEHLDLILGGNRTNVKAIQELLGYGLVYGNPLQIFPIWYGEGNNGKSVTINVALGVLGEYATSAHPAVFMAKRVEGTATPEVLALRDCRLVVAVESEKGHRLNESLIKQMTGGDLLVGRYLFSNAMERFRPSHLAVLVTNPLPIIRGIEDAIWRRVLMWPFEVKIPPDRRVPDYEAVLLEEAPGILNWMLEGLRRYYDAGKKITIPEAVLKATAQHRAAMDVLAPFLLYRCVRAPGEIVQRDTLYNEYVDFCHANDEEPLNVRQFATELQVDGRGIKDGGAVKGKRRWVGLRLKTVDELRADEAAGSMQERL